MSTCSQNLSATAGPVQRVVGTLAAIACSLILSSEARGIPGDLLVTYYPTAETETNFGATVVSVGAIYGIGVPEKLPVVEEEEEEEETEEPFEPDALKFATTPPQAVGRVFIYTTETSTPTRILNDPAPFGEDEFGGALGASQRHIFVGAPGKKLGVKDKSGVAYIFDAPTTDSSSILPAFTALNYLPNSFDRLGASVAGFRRFFAAGAPSALDQGIQSGRVDVYDMKTRLFKFTLVSPTTGTEENTFFGSALAMNNSRLIVSEPGASVGAPRAGVAHVFNVRKGALLRTLTNPAPEEDDSFSTAVAIRGQRVAIGAPGKAVGGAARAGAVFIYNAANGRLLRAIPNPAPNPGDFFGATVAFTKNNIVIGCPQDNGIGSVFIFRVRDGRLLLRIDNPVQGIGDGFGQAVAPVHPNRILVGAPFTDDDFTTDVGRAYLFEGPKP